MAQPQTTPQDHLAKAREYIAIAESADSKREAYMKAADEILAAQKDDPTLSFNEIDRRLGKSKSGKYSGRLVQWRTRSTAPSGSPFQREEGKEVREGTRILRDPEQRRRVVSRMDDDEMDAIRDTVAEERLNRARARAEEHRPSEPDRKAREAELDEDLRAPTMKALGSMVSPDAYIESAISTMKLIEAESLQMANYEHCIELLQELNDRMWRYGAVHGFDVSKIAEAAAKLRGEES